MHVVARPNFLGSVFTPVEDNLSLSLTNVSNYSSLSGVFYFLTKKSMKYKTNLIHAGEIPNLKEGGSGDVVIPIHVSSTFARKEIAIPTGGYEYSRSGNPTRNALEERLAVLENAKYGLAFASGLAAETVLILSLLQSGNHIISSDDLYGGTRRLFSKIFKENLNIAVSYVDMTDTKNILSALTPRTKMIWLETPTNPLIKIFNITVIAKIAKEKNILLIVDNTFMSPYFQQPLSLGADIVVHSTTKYINGHSDSIGGAIMLNDESIYEKLKFSQNATGAILSPFDSFLVLRGIKTLAVRMEQHAINAQKIALFLENHPRVSKVYYPGLLSHPQYEIARKQMTGFGGMLSFDIKGDIEDAKIFLENVSVFALAESLGGVESLIEHPALMTHASVDLIDRKKIGLSDTLIRVSVGIEDVEDLIGGLTRGFNALR